MSAFYGQVSGQADTLATRRGSYKSGIRSSAQSWDGSITTELGYYSDGELNVVIEVSDGSDFGGYTIFDGTFDEFKERLERR